VVAGSAQQLILTVTRDCDLRCSYCPTAKDGWPSLSADDARQAIDLFASRYGGGAVKLFGGEPLLVPEVCRAAIDSAVVRPEITRVYLSTNGLGLTSSWLDLVRATPKLVLTISLDGRPQDHRRLRRAAPGVETPDAYEHLMGLLPLLVTTQRVVLTQTIAPATASDALANFNHLVDLGFRRFNLLPGYYLPWRRAQLTALEAGFTAIGDRIEQAWANGERLYLRNLYTRAPLPFFNSGLVVDADRSIHPCNVGLSGQLDGLRGQTRLGDLDDPPTAEALVAAASRVPSLLQAALDPQVWQSTLAVDALLTALCRRLLRVRLEGREAEAG
jgi:MoaA/NifB/PqqE/SkfB family radical SAM enzyme